MVKQIRGGEAGLAIAEASLTLALLGRVPWKDGVGHAGLMQRATDGAGIGLGTGCASALVCIGLPARATIHRDRSLCL